MNTESNMKLFCRLSYISRKRKLELFYKTMKPTGQTRVLDVGGQTSPDTAEGLQLIDLYPWTSQVSVVNIARAHVDLTKGRYPQVAAVVGDACELPWPDRSFDIVAATLSSSTQAASSGK